MTATPQPPAAAACRRPRSAAAIAACAAGLAVVLAAAAAPAQEPAPRGTTGGGAGTPPDQALTCRGNEPFWALDMGRGSAVLRRPGPEQVEETTFTGTLDTLGFLDPPWHVWRGAAVSGTGAADPAVPPLVAVVREGTCRDTMRGDLRDARAVVVLPGGGTVTGCCSVSAGLSPKPAAGADIPFADYGSKPISDWSRYLPDLLPAIDACIRAAEAPADRVLKAWPMDRGMAAVRFTLAGTGAAPARGVVDCVASLGGVVESLDRRTGDPEPLAGQGEPVFLPGRESPPEIDCGHLERVSGPRGEAVSGYLLYDRGCG